MVSFHHDTQRLAVGTQIGAIAIYDIRTSAKWRVLDGHKGRVVCVQFNSNGHYLASYSNSDLTLRLWKVGNSGLFGGIIGVAAQAKKQISLKPIRHQHKSAREEFQRRIESQVGRDIMRN